MFRSSRLNIILLLVALCAVVGAVTIWRLTTTSSSLQRDPVSGNTLTTGSNAPADQSVSRQSGYQSSVLSDDTLFDKGLEVEEFRLVVGMMTRYTKKRFGDTTTKTYSVDPASVQYNDASDTFVFRLVRQDGGERFHAELVRPQFNYVHLTLRENSGKVVYDTTEKVNPYL